MYVHTCIRRTMPRTYTGEARTTQVTIDNPRLEQLLYKYLRANHAAHYNT